MTELTRLRGKVVFPDGSQQSEIVMDTDKGVIVSVEPLSAGEDDGRLIFPGFIDAHVHAREYPAPADAGALKKWEASCRKETFATAGKAALNGGITVIGAMPNDPEPPNTPERYSRKLKTTSASACPVVLFASITPDSEPWGDLPYKVYFDVGPSAVSFSDWKEPADTLKRYKDCRVFFHAEDPDILLKFKGPGPRRLTRPPEAEITAVRNILELTAKYGLRTHICHISTAKTVQLIEDYNRSADRKVTGEVSPHHLFFSIDPSGVYYAQGHVVAQPGLLECNPPVRSEDDRRRLISALKDGIISVLASDHAPHTLRDKENGSPGMPHLDTLGPFTAWLMRDCGFTPQRIAQVMSVEPARLFASELDHGHGLIAPGAGASLTVLDLKDSTLVKGNKILGRGPLQTRCGWSPFEGIPLPAGVSATIVRGQEYRF